MTWRLPGREISFPRRPLVMGIVNVNDDSFCGDGSLEPGRVLDQVRHQVGAGADIIDLGAESARTNRGAIPVGEELARLVPVLEGWPGALEGMSPRDEEQVWPPVLSVNTWRPAVVEGVLAASAAVELINDMGGLPVDDNARHCAAAGASLLIMHTGGEPKVAQTDRKWDRLMEEMRDYFIERIERACSAGMDEDAIVLDPGIDFAKQREDNLEVFRELASLAAIGRPLLVPVSRKTVIGEVLGLEDPLDRDAGTVACLASAMGRGGAIFRVHDAGAAWAATRVLDSIDAESPGCRADS